MRKKTNLIRVFEDDISWLDNKANNFFNPFNEKFKEKNHHKKKLTRAETVKGIRKLLEGSDIFFPDNMINKSKKKFSLEYKRGRFKL